MTRTRWDNCYDDQWKGLMVDEAHKHPAKFSRGLIRRIYRHLFDAGYVRQGDTVVDPFGGVSLGGLDAMTHGLHWIGCELEPHFHDLGNQNIALWNALGFPGTATLLKGDSRRLCEVVGAALGKFSDAMKADLIAKGHGPARGSTQDAFYGHAPGQLGNMPSGSVEAVISSPPFSPPGNHPTGRGQGVRSDYNEGKKRESSPDTTYGETHGQLAAMPIGSIDAILSSPPYADEVNGQHGETETAEHSRAKRRTEGGSLGQSQRHGGYGTSDGNLSGLAAGAVEAVVSSPPFMDQEPSHAQNDTPSKRRLLNGTCNMGARLDVEYGKSDGQLGNDSGETFWAASKIIVEQCYSILKSGGVAVFVLKDFVRKGQRVPFSDDWRRLCEACGFELVEWIEASLVKEERNPDLFGGEHVKRRERKSFFRRLAEKRGSPRIDHEDVLILRKP